MWRRVGGRFWTLIGTWDNRIFGLFYGRVWRGLGGRVRRGCFYAFRHAK